MKSLLPILKTKLFLLSFVFACTAILANNYLQREDFFKFKEEKQIAAPDNAAVRTQKIADKKLNLQLRDNLFNATSTSFEATVQTDKADYSPGEYVVITGSGWLPATDLQPGETVALNIVSDCGCTNVTYYAIADENGNISNSEFLITEEHLGASFLLTATGLTSGQIAAVTFTDSHDLELLIMPANVALNTNRQFTLAVRLEDNVTVGSVRITHPTDWDDDVVIGAVEASGTKNWTATYDAPNRRVNLSANSTTDRLTATGEVVAVTITITSLGNSGVKAWQAAGFGNTTFNGTNIAIPDQKVNIGTNSKEATAVITPTNAAANSSTAYTLTFTRTVGGDPLGTVAFHVPFGYTITAVSSVSAPAGKTWTAVHDVSSGLVRLQANTDPSRLTSNGQAVSVTVTATAPATNGTSQWKTGIWKGFHSDDDPFNITTQPSVTISSGCLTPPACSINGAAGPVCPSSSNDYTAPAGMNVYLWQITSGAATITAGEQDDQVATVTAGTACDASYTLKLTITDANGCTSTCSQTVSVDDNTPPVLTTGGGSLSLSCNPAASDINASLGTATATDACGIPTVSQSDGSVSSDGCNRTQTRTFTARDICGNTSTASRSVTWIADVTLPVLTTGGSSTTLGCNPAASDINASLGTATATDACGVPTVSQSNGSVSSNGCNRTQTRTFTARDFCGNTSTASRTVVWIEDETPPVLTTGGGSLTLSCNPAASDINASLGTATATDACGVPTVTPVDGSVISDGCSRSQTRTFTATDACNKTATVARTVTWTEDNALPSLTTGGTGTNLGCNPSAGDIDGALGTATSTDACGVPTISQSDGAVVSEGCSRSQTRTFTAIDACNKTSTASRTVTWIEDDTPPVLTSGGTTLTLDCNPSAGDINGALGTATATDFCGVPTVTPSDAAIVSEGCSRSQTRTFTAKDACDKTSTASRTVTWTEDVTGPTLTSGGTGTSLGCNPTAGDINGALGTATATDACGVPTIAQSDGLVISNGCNRSQTRTFTATDACNKTSTVSRTATWTEDNTPPVLTTGGTGTSLGCNPTAGDINGALGTATATDACGTPTVTPGDGAVSSNGCSRSQTRTFVARDFCGNTSTASRTATWTEDVTAPVLTSGGTSLSLGCNPSAGDINAALGTATATDGCSTPTITVSDGGVSSATCSRSQTRTFRAIDACGNTSTASRTATWTVDPTSPTIPTTFVSKTCLWPPNHKMVDIELAATDGCGPIATSNILITSNEPANDIGDGNTEVDWEIVDGNTIRLRAERSGVNNLVTPDTGRIYTVTYSVTDGCGNTASRTNIVTVAHNITHPKPGNAYPINTTVSLAGTFWDVPGKTHTAKWIADATTVNGTVTAEPSGNKMGKVTGSFKPTVAGVYKLRMNVTDQTGVTSYATTSGDFEAYFVAYDPKGGYTYGAGQFKSPAGALTAQPNLTDVVTFGFTSNYYKNATNPKGETQIDFKLTDGNYSFAFNALNYDYLVVNGSNATYKGLGKTIINGVEQSGFAFILKVIDGKTPTNPNGVDKIRMKIYNKNTGAVIYDNQMGASETADPTLPVDEPNADGSDIVVVSTAAPGTSADITSQNAQMEVVAPEITKFNVKAFPNPTGHQFTLYLEGASNEKVQIVVYDAVGRQVKKIERGGIASGAIRFGEDLKVGAYIVEVRQGVNRKTLKLVKQ